MVTTRKPRPATKSPANKRASAPARRAPTKSAAAMPRKVDRIIKRRAPALRKLD